MMDKDTYTNNNSQNNDFLNEKITDDEVVIDANDIENCEEGSQKMQEELSSEEKTVDAEKENISMVNTIAALIFF